MPLERMILIIVEFLYFFVFVFSLTRRRNYLAQLFSLAVLAGMVYVGGYFFELGSQSVEELQFWLKVEYFGLSFMPTLVLVFAWKFNRKQAMPSNLTMVIFAIPFVTLLLSSTNEYHHLYYRQLSFVRIDGMSIAHIAKGPWYYVFTVYMNCIVLLSLAIFFQVFRKNKSVIRAKAFWFFAGTLIVVGMELLYAFGLTPYGIDIVPFSFFFAVLCFAIAIFRYEFLKSNDLFKEIIFTKLSEGALLLDQNGRIADYNDAAARMFSWLSPEAIGYRIQDLPVAKELLSQIEAGKTVNINCNGREFYYELKITNLKEQGAEMGKVYLFKDITRLRRIMRTLYRLANFDSLTGVFVRRRFFEEAEKELARSIRYKKQFAIFMIDVDNLKEINDTFGHQAGDAVLKALAKALKARLRKSDIFGRYGGDEFSMVLVEIDYLNSMLMAESFISMVRNLEIPFHDRILKTTVSIGVMFFKGVESDMTIEHLLSEADKALYQAKKEGRNRFVAAKPL